MTERAASPGKGRRVSGGNVGPSRAGAWEVRASFLLDPSSSLAQDSLAQAAAQKVGWGQAVSQRGPGVWELPEPALRGASRPGAQSDSGMGRGHSPASCLPASEPSLHLHLPLSLSRSPGCLLPYSSRFPRPTPASKCLGLRVGRTRSKELIPKPREKTFRKHWVGVGGEGSGLSRFWSLPAPGSGWIK